MADDHAEAAAPGLLRFAPALVSTAAFIWFLTMIGRVSGGEPLVWATPWLPSMEVEFAVLVDGLGLVFALLVTGIGALVLLYTAEYFATDPRRDKLLTLLVLFEIAMLGLVLADDALTLFLFWEGTTITSFLLIGFEHEKEDARAKAIQALIVTGLGGVALLGGLLLWGAEAGTFRLSELDATITESGLYLPIFILVMLGCFTKSAQIPFHFWLPNAMAAPTPVSAYLHSATMVKAGVYLLARLSPSLGGTDLWLWTLTLFGGATMLLASVWSLRQTDLKLALAHTTVMGLGTLTMLLGVGGEGAIVGACTFLIVHAFYKASLFLAVGILDKKAGSREVDDLSGLGGAMPLTWAAAALAAASMAGFPPFLGFIGKEEMYEGALHGHAPAALVLAAAVLANAMMIAVAGAVGLRPFVGERAAGKEPADGPLAMWTGPALLALLGLVFGLFGGLIDESLVAPMAASILGEPVEVHLYLWHGINLPLLLSLLTFALGIGLYLVLPPVRRRLIALEADGALPARDSRDERLPDEIVAEGAPATRGLASFEDGYDRGMAGLARGAGAVTDLLQSGIFSRYLRFSMGVLAALILLALAAGGRLPDMAVAAPPALEVMAVTLIAAGTLVLPFTRKRLLMITALGVVGAGVALLFALFGAIDVAITQLMVETLVVIIIAVALLKLPRIHISREARARRAKRVNAVIAAALGLAVTMSLGLVLEGPLDLRITEFYENASYTLAFGKNIVNVILVDFRALDTLGEIAVVAIAGVSALALLAAKTTPLKDRDQ